MSNREPEGRERAARAAVQSPLAYRQQARFVGWLAEHGERGETLGRVCGVWPSGMPQSWVGSLINSNDSRIKAVVVHNPKGEFTNGYKLHLH